MPRQWKAEPYSHGLHPNLHCKIMDWDLAARERELSCMCRVHRPITATKLNLATVIVIHSLVRVAQGMAEENVLTASQCQEYRVVPGAFRRCLSSAFHRCLPSALQRAHVPLEVQRRRVPVTAPDCFKLEVEALRVPVCTVLEKPQGLHRLMQQELQLQQVQSLR